MSLQTYTDNGTNTPNGTHLEFTYTFPVLQTEDVKVALNGVTQATTKYSVSTSPAKITFNNTSVDSSVQAATGAPLTGVLVRVFRETEVYDSNNTKPKASYASGSSIRAQDLNNNQDQTLYAIKELQEQQIANAKVQSGAITSDKIKDGTIVNADINASAAIEGSKLQASSGSNSGTMSSANFTKLAGIATGAEVNVNADWNSSSGDSQILNKPSLVTGINDLSDVNTTGVANGKILKYDSGSSSFVIADDSGGSGGSSTFAGLTDTPTNYTGAAGKTLKVNSSGNAIEFVTVTGSDVVDDTTPQLGGNLDVQAREINTSTTNGNIKVTPNGTGLFEVKGNTNAGTLQLNCENNSHGVKIKSPPHSAAASYTLTLPNNVVNGQFLKTDTNGNLSWAAVDLTALSASNLTSGTIPDARFPATLPAVSGANLTNLTPSDNTVSAAKLTSDAVTNAKILDDTISEAKLDIHAAPSGTDKVLGYTANGMEWVTSAAGATGGGTDSIFWENGQTVTTNYTISNNKNAMSAGPITINNGIAVTIGTGENWTIV